jgi:hypothetical protein
MIKIIPASEITESLFSNYTEYIKKGIDNTISLANYVNSFYPCIAMVEYDEVTEEGYNYFQNSFVRLTITEHPEIEIRIKSDWRNKHYMFSCRTTSNIYNSGKLTKSTYDNTIVDIKEPNNIGVGKLTTKKIEGWINYHVSCYNALKVALSETENKVSEFLKEIEGEKIDWYNGSKTKGRIVKNGISFEFHIQGDYISQKISIHYSVTNSFKSFAKLADNKYTG